MTASGQVCGAVIGARSVAGASAVTDARAVSGAPAGSGALAVAGAVAAAVDGVASVDRGAAADLAASTGAGAVAGPSVAVVVPGLLASMDRAARALLDAAGRADEWEASVRQEVLAWLTRHRDVLAAIDGRVLTAERDAGTWSLRGDRDLAGFVGRTSRGGRAAGMAAVGQAGTLAAMPAVAEALVEGPVSSAHVAQITRATRQSAVLAAELASPEGQAHVVELARRLDGAEFGKALARLSASVDPAGRQRLHDEQRAARSLTWTHTAAGTVLAGRLDTVAGHRLAKVIDALCPRPALDDERSRPQRQADALMALVERAAADAATTPGAVAPVQGIVTFSEATWVALRAARRSEGGVAAATRDRCEGAPTSVAGSATDVIDRLPGAEPVTDQSGQAWPASEIARSLCDCALTWAMVDTPGTELNLGRQSRTFRRQHWLALYAAGVTSCSVGGCGMPLAYCELHHLVWWNRDGGRTDLANCAPYCSFHHHEIHRLGIVAVRRPDGTLTHRHPDGRPYGGAPPGVLDEDLEGPPGRAATGAPAPAASEGVPSRDRGVRRGEESAPAGGGDGDPPRDLLDLLTG